MMKTVKSIFFLAVAMMASVCGAAEGGEVLWWLIGDGYESLEGTTEDGRTMTAGELGVTDVRIRYESSDGSSSGYLTLFGVNDDGSVSVLDGSAGIGGEHGVGLPAGYFGDLSGLSGASYNFVVELGNWESGRWTNTAMESEKVAYDTLVASKHITEWEGTSHSYGTPWSPTSFSVVPEPASGIMVLVGGALLALRRKRRNG